MNNNYVLLTLFVSITLFFNLPNSFAEDQTIFIPYSTKMNDLEFDGKWSYLTEWKESGIGSVGESLKIRTAHYENFVYVFVDALYDSSLDKGSDRAMVCIELQNSKSLVPDENDYCFGVALGREVGFTLQGNSPPSSKNNFKKISNHEDFIAVGGISDQNDRYLKTPHPSYEFRIPTDLIQRNDQYGFYVDTFDAKSGKSVTWPENISKQSPISIPSPSLWGEMISIDKSLPEFPLPLFLLVIVLLSVIIMSRKLNYGRLRINTH